MTPVIQVVCAAFNVSMTLETMMTKRSQFSVSPYCEIHIGPGSCRIAIASADFDSDGKPDREYANSANNSVAVSLNEGIGAFSRTFFVYDIGGNPYGMVAKDFGGTRSS